MTFQTTRKRLSAFTQFLQLQARCIIKLKAHPLKYKFLLLSYIKSFCNTSQLTLESEQEFSRVQMKKIHQSKIKK